MKMTEVAQLSGSLNISLKTHLSYLVLCMCCHAVVHLLLCSLSQHVVHFTAWSKRFVGNDASLRTTSSQKYLHVAALFLVCFVSLPFCWWMDMSAYSLFWLSACLWGVTVHQIAFFFFFFLGRASSFFWLGCIRAELYASGGLCNFTEVVSCLVTLSIMESSSFHYPHF